MVESNKSKYLNATTLGQHFNTSSQRINLILSELGFIEKDITGWKITKLGKTLGGKQCEHDTSGNRYVIWSDQILKSPRLSDVFRHEKNEKQETKNEIVHTEKSEAAVFHKEDFREKFEAKLRTQDGHFVRSKSEIIIDNFLYQYGLVHAYERKLPIEEDVYCDFYIPSGKDRPQGVYIEYWGIENDEKYEARKKRKLEIYKKEDLNLIELNELDVQNLDDVFPRKLLQHKIKVY
jgi:hypothetical protein